MKRPQEKNEATMKKEGKTQNKWKIMHEKPRKTNTMRPS